MDEMKKELLTAIAAATTAERALWDAAACAVVADADGPPERRALFAAETADALLAERRKRRAEAAPSEPVPVVTCGRCGVTESRRKALGLEWAGPADAAKLLCPACCILRSEQ